MKVTFLVPSTKRVIGGVTSLYEFASAHEGQNPQYVRGDRAAIFAS